MPLSSLYPSTGACRKTAAIPLSLKSPKNCGFLISDLQEFLRVGVITSTHGIKGEVKVYPTTDDAERFLALKVLVHRAADNVTDKKLTFLKRHGIFPRHKQIAPPVFFNVIDIVDPLKFQYDKVKGRILFFAFLLCVRPLAEFCFRQTQAGRISKTESSVTTTSSG